MSKKLQKITTMSAAAVLATTAIVPVAASAATTEAPATEVTHVIFKTDQGVLASLPMETYEQAVAAGALKSEGATHIKLGNGEVYLMETYEQAIAAGLTPEQAAQKLIDDVQAIDEKVVDGKVENGKVVVKDEVAEDLKVESVKAINLSTVAITFNNAVQDVKAEDFKVDGKMVKSISLSADKKTVRLTVDEMEYGKDYKLTANVNNQKIEQTFTSPAITDLWDLVIKVEGDSITADGIDTKLVTFELRGEDGEIDTEANDVVLEVNTTRGNLSQERVTIQNGVGQVILRSEFFADEQTARIDAQIIEAETAEYKELIGQIIGTKYIQFVPEGADSEGGEQYVVKSLVSANTNEADRVTLLFDEEMTNSDFYNLQTGKLLNNLKVSQKDEDAKDIWAVEIDQKNKKKVTVYLTVVDKEGKRTDKHNYKYLTDNKDVKVSFKDVKTQKETERTFKLADARIPNVTGVEYQDPKTIKVSFSEGIQNAKFVIDGQWVEGKDFDVHYGDLDKYWNDNRNVVTIKLKEDNYFSGAHAIETSSIKDFAAVTDPKNIGSTQVLEFNAPVNNEVAKPIVSVDSPEQIHLSFDQPIKGLKNEDIKFEVKNKEGKWVPVNEHNFGGEEATYVITNPEKNVFKLEMTKDWTVIYDTKNTKQNHYNDQFRLSIPEYKTAINGKESKAVTIDLTDTALSQPDITSPVIKGMKTNYNKDNSKVIENFDVYMSEPVKLNGILDSSAADTPAQNQVKVPETQVEFLGTYKGKTYTLYGKVLGYNKEDSTDKTIQAMWLDKNDPGHEPVEIDGKTINTPQEFVDAGGSSAWTLVVKSISDDVGNTAATESFDFTINATEKPTEPGTPEAPKTPFMVQNGNGEAIGDHSYAKHHNDSTLNEKFAVQADVTGEKELVEITYTEAVALTGEGSAINVNNYTLNGKNLPVGTTIAVKPVADDKSQTVVISLPKNTLNESNVITLAKHIKSKDGVKINHDVAFTFKTGSSIQPVISNADKVLKDLQALIDELVKEKLPKTANGLEEAKTALELAKTEAEKLVANEDATEEEIEEGIKDLQKAIKDANDAKDLAEAKKPLEEDIKTAEAKKFVEDDQKVADKAIAEAKKALEDAKTPAEATAAKDKLKKDLEGLEVKVTELYLTKLPEKEQEDYKQSLVQDQDYLMAETPLGMTFVALIKSQLPKEFQAAEELKLELDGKVYILETSPDKTKFEYTFDSKMDHDEVKSNAVIKF